MANRRVVVTGIGVVTSIGIGREKFWKNLISGKSGISKVESLDTAIYDTHKGGEVKDFNPSDFINSNEIKNTGRATQFAIGAVKLAIEDAKIKIDSISKDRIGVVMGTTMADSQKLEEIDRIWLEAGEKQVNMRLIPQYPGNSISNNIGFEFGFKNLVSTMPTACSAGNYSIGYSYFGWASSRCLAGSVRYVYRWHSTDHT